MQPLVKILTAHEEQLTSLASTTRARYKKALSEHAAASHAPGLPLWHMVRAGISFVTTS